MINKYRIQDSFSDLKNSKALSPVTLTISKASGYNSFKLQ
jgi:hypothetical protein